MNVVASASGLLNAWIDFNDDGDWSDAGEQVFNDLWVTAGTNSLSFAVPSGAATASSFARFRLSNQSGLMLDGLAPDGEIEDYAVSLGVSVVGRHIFYNRSLWDGNNAAANANDDAAIATNKTPLLPGVAAGFANYTSYTRGINGIMIDVLNLPGTPTAADFVFRKGNTNKPYGNDLSNPADDWAFAPAPTSISVREGAGVGDPDRVTIIWADNAIQQCWLQVTVKATDVTGLLRNDVFYVGNAIGESVNIVGNTYVNALDEVVVRNNPHGRSNPAPIDDEYDFNRDKNVNALDEIAARNNPAGRSNALVLFTPPLEPTGGAGEGEGEGEGGWMVDSWSGSSYLAAAEPLAVASLTSSDLLGAVTLPTMKQTTPVAVSLATLSESQRYEAAVDLLFTLRSQSSHLARPASPCQRPK